jgi:hypothetical protein
LYDFGKNLKDRDAKQQIDEILDNVRELKQSASELEDRRGCRFLARRGGIPDRLLGDWNWRGSPLLLHRLALMLSFPQFFG